MLRIALVLALGVLVGCSLISSTVDAKVTVNGHTIRYVCRGPADAQTIVFEAAIGGDDTLWPIADRLSDSFRTCTYDRPGNGDSSAPAQPMTAAADAADLHELLGAAQIKAPVVLVGHSYGGLVSYTAALSHPEDVHGLVLIDSSHPGQLPRFRALMSDAQRQILEASYANFPFVDFVGSASDPGPYGSLGALPLTVLTATKGFTGDECDPQLPCASLQAAWLQMQAEYAALSSDGRHVEVDSGHYIQDAQPDLVVAEIRALAARAVH